MGNDTTVLYYDRGDSMALWNRNDAATQLTTDSTIVGAMGTTSSFKMSNNDGNLNGGWLHSLGGLYKPVRISYYVRITETVKACAFISLREYKNYQWNNCVNVFVNNQGQLMTHYQVNGAITTTPGYSLLVNTWYKVDVALSNFHQPPPKLTHT